MPATHLWYQGRIFTGRRFVEALLVDDGRVTAVGSIEEVRRSAPTGTEVHDLAGRFLIPGLIDAHLHLLEIARMRTSLDVRGVRSFDALAERIRAWGRDHPKGAIVGGGWEAEQFAEGRAPDREVLDRAEPDRPVVLYHTSGHSALVSGAVLAAVGIDAATPDPPGGRIGRGPDGSPNGLLFEDAMRSVGTFVSAEFPPDPATLGSTLESLPALGLTTVATMSAGAVESRILRELSGGARPTPRVRAYARLARLTDFSDSELTPRDPDGRFGVIGVKAFTDGAFGPRTAWLSEPYADRPETDGLPVGSEQELAESIAAAAARGLAPALHAIGDRAVARALRLVAPWVGKTPSPARIEHAALTPPAILGELDRIRPALVVQPGFVWSDAWLGERLGRSRARWAYAFRSLIERGHLLAGSSDAPFDPIDPFRGLTALHCRRDPLGRSANPAPEEALSAEEAFAVYTVNGGRALGEDDLGRLEPGARADLVIVDAPDAGRAIQEGASGVRETWVAGRCLYARPNGSGG